MSTTSPVDSAVLPDLFDFELDFLEFPGLGTHDPFGITMATCVLVYIGQESEKQRKLNKQMEWMDRNEILNQHCIAIRA